MTVSKDSATDEIDENSRYHDAIIIMIDADFAQGRAYSISMICNPAQQTVQVIWSTHDYTLIRLQTTVFKFVATVCQGAPHKALYCPAD